MKEQAMPLIAQKFAIEVMHRRRPTGLPIRSVTDYITAMRFYHMRRAGKTRLDVQPTDLVRLVKNAISTVMPAADAKALKASRVRLAARQR